MITTEHEIVVQNRYGNDLYATITQPEPGPTKLPIMLLLHGFKGFRNYSFLPWTAQHASGLGSIVVRMCFSLNGMSNTSWSVQRLEDFASNTISRECDDAADMIQALRSDVQFVNLRDRWDGTISIVGHSRGGGIAMIAARELQMQSPSALGKVVVWNSVGTWVRWTSRQASQWKTAGTIEMQNQRTLQMLNMHATYLEDIELNSERLDLITASRELHGRIRYIHAVHDLTVPIKEIQHLVDSSGNHDALYTIGNTTHTFGMEHPVQRITQGFVDALRSTFPWVLE